MENIRRILLATDFSPASRGAFEQALAFCRRSGAELVLAHVYRMPGTLPADMALTPDTAEQIDAKLAAVAESRLRALLEEARRQEIRGRILLLSGAPGEAIVEAARKAGADMLILGTHGRTGVARLLLGSVASKVIATASCPVLTVRAA
ncbi:MAG TPA: universal stress protein [Thermoanaerobaculia bacterium]|jgi:nucleotide-binding universal stress UspA family protein